MKVSVIIPTFNEEKIVLACLKSLEGQTLKNFEVIVVDDGSNDETLSILESFESLVFDFRVYKQKHKGPAIARNLGAKHARGDILVFVDADMTFDAYFLQRLVKPIFGGEFKGTFSRDEYVVNWDNIWARCWNFNQGLRDKRRLPKDYPDEQDVFRAILRSEFEKVGGYDVGGYTDDYTLGKKLPYKAASVDGAIFYHSNPESLAEVFRHARWVAKREYKLGYLGVIIALLRVSLPVSLFVAILESLKYGELWFFVFKLVYDLAIFIGILEYYFLGRGAK